MRQLDEKQIVRKINIKVVLTCMDSENSFIDIGSKKCIDCFQEIYRNTNQPCQVYSKGMYFRERTLLLGTAILQEMPSHGPINITSPYDNMHL